MFSGNLIEDDIGGGGGGGEACNSAFDVLTDLVGPGLVPKTLRVKIELPKGGRVKVDQKSGALDFISPVSTPFNYGHVVGKVLENGDGDNLDAIVLGERVLEIGTVVTAVPVGIVGFIHRGKEDHKLVTVIAPKDVYEDAQDVTSFDKMKVDYFFKVYAHARKVIDFCKGYGLSSITNYTGTTWL